MTSEYTFKIVIVGDSGVGKTNLIRRYTEGKFLEFSEPTIGVEFGTKIIEYAGKSISAQLWDTAGQERFRAIASAYYRGARGAIICYSVIDSETFDNVAMWQNEVFKNGESDCCIMLLGNKADLDESRQVDTEVGETFGEENGLLFFETSAKSGQNVEEAFEALVQHIYDSTDHEETTTSHSSKPEGVDLRKARGETSQRRCCGGGGGRKQ